MTTLKTLESWLTVSAENEHMEFKEAKRQYGRSMLLKYCVAFANEGGGHLVLGVTNTPPRKVVGTRAFSSLSSLNKIKNEIVDRLRLRVEVTALNHADGRVLVFEIPGRPIGRPVEIDGRYLMRAGESLRPMTPDVLQGIFAEGDPPWSTLAARKHVDSDDVIALLDTQIWFTLINRPYPTTRAAVLENLASEGFIVSTVTDWTITNLGAILLAKQLDKFSPMLARKAPRVVIYRGKNKLDTRLEQEGVRGYAVNFEGLVEFVHSSAPNNKIVEEVVRKDVKMFPRQALRELIANALVHQDFHISGASVMIELYEDRLEISNPGVPKISVERFIDSDLSRNERITYLMRRMGICEEKGSGIDKVVAATESHQLPAPDFRTDNLRTIVVLFAHKEFSKMNRVERIRVCYQHCVLRYVSSGTMSNQSLRERLGLDNSSSSTSTTSQIIAATKNAELIKLGHSKPGSTRYARYLPWWA